MRLLRVRLATPEIELPAGKGFATLFANGAEGMTLVTQAKPIGRVGCFSEAALIIVARKGFANEFLLRHRWPPVAGSSDRGADIVKRRDAPHPEALLLECCDLVADPLGGDFALELGEGEQSGGFLRELGCSPSAS